MKRLRLSDVPCGDGGHVLRDVLPGAHLSNGGISFKRPGERSHDAGCACPACDGKGRHVHPEEYEAFILLQGRARMEIDGRSHDMAAGDIIVCEPGEDHHLVADGEDPCVNLTLHASPVHHALQKAPPGAGG